MGVTPGAEKTFPAVAKRMAFVRPDQVIDVATAIIMVQRDFGNRVGSQSRANEISDRQWGLREFKAKVEEYYGQRACRSASRTTCTASTITWAGTSKATAAGSMA